MFWPQLYLIELGVIKHCSYKAQQSVWEGGVVVGEKSLFQQGHLGEQLLS